ncbi:MAG TPA: tripartite tricarboxylate transporter substrate binding protein [Burkholderiales bacterium]|nr:tripartite tricarboxylate transporter substrate binding protein [Burkholderiales bacterium]
MFVLISDLAHAAQAYPTRPIRMLVGFPAGGTSDILARMLGDRLGHSLHEQIVVDNRAGASGNIAAELAARATPDGHTWLLSSGSNTVAPALYRKLGYDPLRDFTHVTILANVPFALVLHPSVPARSVKELIAIAQANPRHLNFASSGIGTPAHLAGELFVSATGIQVVHIPYKGTAPAMVDLLAGRVQFYFTSFPGVLPHLQSQKLRAIAVTSAKRSVVAPALPTMDESGVPGYVAGSWYGIALPAGAPQPIVTRLQAEIQAVVSTPEITSRCIEQGLDPVIGVMPDAAARFVREDVARWARVVAQAGVKAD